MTSILPEHIDEPTRPRGCASTPTHGASDGRRADDALEQLYDEHYVRLVRLAVLLLGDVGRAEEVVQDSFVAIYRRMGRPAATA